MSIKQKTNKENLYICIYSFKNLHNSEKKFLFHKKTYTPYEHYFWKTPKYISKINI